MATILVAGTPGTISAQFLAGGVLADPVFPVRLTITPVAGGAAVLDTTAVDHPGTGVVTYTWTPGAVDDATDYLAQWDAAGAGDTPATEVLTVMPALSAAWASPAEVLAVTGLTRDTVTCALASSMVSTYCGAYPDMPTDSIGQRDRLVLTRATSWQAAWLTPTKLASLITEREGASDVSADGVRVARRMAAETMLAPLCIRELLNLSWVGTNTVLVPPVSRRRRSWDEINFLNERSDGVI